MIPKTSKDIIEDLLNGYQESLRSIAYQTGIGEQTLSRIRNGSMPSPTTDWILVRLYCQSIFRQ